MSSPIRWQRVGTSPWSPTGAISTAHCPLHREPPSSSELQARRRTQRIPCAVVRPRYRLAASRSPGRTGSRPTRARVLTGSMATTDREARSAGSGMGPRPGSRTAAAVIRAPDRAELVRRRRSRMASAFPHRTEPFRNVGAERNGETDAGGSKMATFVIVHGAWSGAHAWRKVRPLLRSAGHEVFTPALTGLGERAHLATPDVDLDTHIEDVVGVMEYEDLREVVLVGHSYGGVVITGAAERLAERLAQLGTWTPRSPRTASRSTTSRLPTSVPRTRNAPVRGAMAGASRRQCLRPCPMTSFPTSAGCSRGWSHSQQPPSPSLCGSKTPLQRPLPRTYIFCTVDKDGHPPPAYVERARSDPAWRYRELAAGHAPHVTAPRDLSDLLLELAPVER